MHAWYVFVVLELPLMPQPADDPHAQKDGIDAQRVLLFGCGLVEGFGVLSHQIALSGRIAMELGGATGRGVNVELEVHRRRGIASASRAINSMDAQPFDAVIVSIGAGEAMTLMPPVQWDRKMKSLLVAIAESNGGGGQVVIAGIQPFCLLSGSPLRIAEAHARKLNNVTRLLCSELPNVHFVSLRRSNPLNERRTAVMYLEWAKRITRVLAPRISGSVKKRTSLHDPTAPKMPLDVVSVLPLDGERLSAAIDPQGGKNSPDRLAS